MTLLPVDQALIKVTESLKILPSEKVSLAKAHNRVLAEDIFAKLTQPPFNSSAMDGYAVKAENLKKIPVTLAIVGESAAGHGFSGSIKSGEAVRIFTGAPVPEGADTVVIQENTSKDGSRVTINKEEVAGSCIRLAGMDFHAGDTMLPAGKVLKARDLALAAAMNYHELPVRRCPVVAILATGDELVEPGQKPNSDQIVSSIPYGLAPLIESWGGVAQYLGIANDTIKSLTEKIERSKGADILVTIGGASVGDHDLAQKALRDLGMELNFWKVAMRPGKPLMQGILNETHVLGIPGNPISAMICSHLFLRSMIRKQLGIEGRVTDTIEAVLKTDLPENGPRQHYMRANSQKRSDGRLDVTPAQSQDSSLLGTYAASDCLIVRSPHAPAAKSGEVVNIILI